MQYVVLKAISPPEGAIIEPAVATVDNPAPAPILVDESLFSGDTTEERVANIARLITAGVIAPVGEATLTEAITPAELSHGGPTLPRRARTKE